MRVLIVHNHYTQPGGEDAVFEAEKALLERMGHEVIPFVEDNARLKGMNPLKAALNAVWSREAQEKLRRLIRETKPDVAHFHNTFLMISPAAYYACKEEGVPVVQTLHNYRLLCVNALFFREGRVCEDCLGRLPWRGVVRGCYRGSPLASGVVAAMLTTHRALGTWARGVDVYIALTEFARRKFMEGGLPAEKIVVKPNFVHPDPGPGEGKGGYALFVGRLSPEKGIRTLLRAWERLGGRVPLKVVGDGPLAEEVRGAAGRLPGVEWLGRKAQEEVYALMGDAAFLVFPSEWYEGFPMVIAEALARGVPILATPLGSQGSIVDHGRTGLLFRPGDPEDLAEKVEWAWTHPNDLREMGREARREYEQKYTAEKNYEILMDIYERARATASGT
ncbi:glycosyl transferase group 1 [Rhodothermus marinus SG0.5JP17-172]|uniref:glycosyltransferase family 4 protein n=1 Tax=Rhodothermus marinus TaxID=29549 RepID=UPI000223D7F9|nr:glycosyltransferase family 4 protein [Rhodothermus marinus]AEN73885.1 glycosyl transferase group 1 [Rhodothermus marinus SG0.5JP17-172]